MLQQPAVPPIDLKVVNVKEFVPFLRDIIRFQPALILSRRSARIKKSKPCLADFQHLKPWVYWPAMLPLLQSSAKESEDPLARDDVSKALIFFLQPLQGIWTGSFATRS